MKDNTTEDEFIKSLDATYARNTKPVTITLTALEVFAIVTAIRAIQMSKLTISELSGLGDCTKEAARKMHECLDQNSLLAQPLNEGWNLEGVSDDG